MENNKVDIEEAKRCLSCKVAKCKEVCPIHNNIPDFIDAIKNENYKKAYEIIFDNNPLGAVCGRVCQFEKQCQGACVRGIKERPIDIGRLEKEVCDWAVENEIYKELYKEYLPIKEENKVAVVGSGPAGLACALTLRKLGHDVTIFEKEEKLGGILYYEIPEYRLPKDIVDKSINAIIESGIKVQTFTSLISKKNKLMLMDNTAQKYITIDELMEEGFKAVFLGIGAEISNLLNIDGVNNEGVCGANEFLRNAPKCEGKKVIVVGGGNVAMDVARVAKRNGADVTVVYRRRREDMPANKDEINAAIDENINFVFQTNLSKISKKENILYVSCDNEKEFDVDFVIMAIGNVVNENNLEENITLTEQGLIKIDENYMTTIQYVFAGGDVVQKKATVCNAIQNGKEAAVQIHKEIT